MFQVMSNNKLAVSKTFRFEKQTLDELTKIAKENKISVNNLLNQMVKYCLKEMQKFDIEKFKSTTDEFLSQYEKANKEMEDPINESSK